jgi:hypothetical protein
MFTQDQISAYCSRFRVRNQPFFFPEESFLESGYAPPGGYVKDFSVIKREERWHLFHIDGRPGERCHWTGNEISFGHASTEDFRHWIRHQKPLAVGDRDWESEHVWAPYVYWWNGRYYMFYMACGWATGQLMSYAVSDDLETWTKWERGPIPGVKGRDAFVREDEGTHYLYYTGEGGIHVAATQDMEEWRTLPPVMQSPYRPYAESCSVHRFGSGWALWYNDYMHVRDGTGDFRSVYIFSDDPLHFDAENLKVFEFESPLDTPYDFSDWISKRPIPVSIELLERGEDLWFVAYFRWHVDRYRLFFGALDWSKDPARIEEIVDPNRLAEVLQRLRAPAAG